MSDDNVTALRGEVIATDRRAAFLSAVASSYDNYAKALDAEPEAIVYVFGGLKQGARVHWLMQGETEGGAVTMLALAQATIMREIVNP